MIPLFNIIGVIKEKLKRFKFEKAFNQVDWNYLDNILTAKGFSLKWRSWIRGCISSSNFSILINGRPRGKILASHGLEQGSPFLFIMIMDSLSSILNRAERIGNIKDFEVGNGALSINNLQFANNMISSLILKTRVSLPISSCHGDQKL